jgi:uncharacterized OsmC-like protein
VAAERKRPGPAALGPTALKDLYERKARVLHRRPELGRGAGQTRVRLGAAGLACEVEGSGGPVLVDLPPADGGTGAAPAPADLLRASLGACLAMDYRLWAARLDVRLDGVEIDLGVEFDTRGSLLSETEVAAGWRRLIVSVTVTSGAPAADLARVVALANSRCPLLGSLSPAIDRVHLLAIVPAP